MKTFLCIAFILCFTSKAFCQTECSKFKNGTFKIVTPQFTSIISRIGSIQTEMLNNDKNTLLTFTVEWISECTYTLKPTNETLKKMPSIPATAVLTVNITRVSQDSYMQTSSSNYSDIKDSCEVFKVKDSK